MSNTQPPLTHPHRLALIEQARKAVLDTRDPNAPEALSPWIERSWRRCLGMGFNPHQPIAFDAVTHSVVRNAIDANQPLLRAAAPVIQSLTRAMANTRYFAILTDASGLVIDVNGPVDRHNPLASSIARVGVDPSERAVGTTAIGATLAELQPVWLHRGEHFFDATSAYSCAGAPIWGPDGQCVGMLDLTGVNVVEQPALKHLVTQSARSIENALALARPHQLLLSLNWPGQTLGGDSDGLVCVDADGHITGLNRPAAEMLGIAPPEHAGHCTDVFAVPLETLFDAARAQRSAMEVPLWSGLRLNLHARLNAGGERMPLEGQGAAVPLKDVETALILRAVEQARGNVMEAARALGISRATVYRKLTRRKSGG